MADNILVVAEQRNGELKKVSLEGIGAAQKLAQSFGGQVEAVVLGSGMGDLAALLAQHGADKVYVADDPSLVNYSSEGYTKVLADLVQKAEPAVVLMGATAFGKDLAPRLAARLGVGLASDCTDFEINGDGSLRITRPIYAGKAIATVVETTRPQMATLRPNVFPVPEPDSGHTAEIEELTVDTGDIHAVVKELIQTAKGRVELTEADVIVSGGRGMGSPDNYAIIEELADVLGAAVGASRAAVDAGWRPHSDQVGQTGKTVSPSLYIACGISGAIQHLAGMKTSKYIVAINKDPEAPIFKVADYGIVGDLFVVVPILTEEFKKLKAES
ncbi:MAG: electron transfer flavoprotein subunit alpha/FixB family protein [Anaerolineae bacterium]